MNNYASNQLSPAPAGHYFPNVKYAERWSDIVAISCPVTYSMPSILRFNPPGTPLEVPTWPIRHVKASARPISRVKPPAPMPPAVPAAPMLDGDAVATLEALGYRKPEAVMCVTQAAEAGIAGTAKIVTWIMQRSKR